MTPTIVQFAAFVVTICLFTSFAIIATQTALIFSAGSELSALAKAWQTQSWVLAQNLGFVLAVLALVHRRVSLAAVALLLILLGQLLANGRKSPLPGILEKPLLGCVVASLAAIAFVRFCV
jgi:hypothetical protein